MRRALSALALLAPGVASAVPVTLAQIAAAATPVPATAEPVAAAPARRLAAIRFEGNRVTQERTLRRELPFSPGQAVSPEQLEQGRQALQNLDLFKKVTLREETAEDGSVTAIYTLRERWYVLGYPRVDANSNGEYAYGLQLDWNNVWGLNHRLRFSGLMKETKREGIGKEQSLVIGYSAPQVFDSLWSVGTGAAYTQRPVTDALGSYTERLDSYEIIGSRALDPEEPNQGWSIGAGMIWNGQRATLAAAEYGSALGPVGQFSYRDLRLNIFSEEGFVASSRIEGAVQGVAADYEFARLNASAIRYWRVGDTAHQTVHAFGDVGLNWDGPERVRTFTLGGVGGLRGYERGFREGNAFYRIGAEWVRPLFKPWVRALVVAEAGNVYDQPDQIELSDTKACLGFGLRLRLPMFVNVQIEAGVAFPLQGGAPRFFAGQVD